MNYQEAFSHALRVANRYKKTAVVIYDHSLNDPEAGYRVYTVMDREYKDTKGQRHCQVAAFVYPGTPR